MLNALRVAFPRIVTARSKRRPVLTLEVFALQKHILHAALAVSVLRTLPVGCSMNKKTCRRRVILRCHVSIFEKCKICLFLARFSRFLLLDGINYHTRKDNANLTR